MPIPLRADDELERLQDTWAADLSLMLDERVAQTFARHFILDLAARYRLTPKPPPKPKR